jgi:hypothetical protein
MRRKIPTFLCANPILPSPLRFDCRCILQIPSRLPGLLFLSFPFVFSSGRRLVSRDAYRFDSSCSLSSTSSSSLSTSAQSSESSSCNLSESFSRMSTLQMRRRSSVSIMVRSAQSAMRIMLPSETPDNNRVVPTKISLNSVALLPSPQASPPFSLQPRPDVCWQFRRI